MVSLFVSSYPHLCSIYNYCIILWNLQPTIAGFPFRSYPHFQFNFVLKREVYPEIKLVFNRSRKMSLKEKIRKRKSWIFKGAINQTRIDNSVMSSTPNCTVLKNFKNKLIIHRKYNYCKYVFIEALFDKNLFC